MCFAPQGCTFSTCQLPKVSETVSFLNFWLGNVLHATRVHFFDISTSKVVRRWCVLYILTWKCASGHNGVQLFISHLTTWLRTRRFSEPTFRPSGATNHWKNTVFSDFPTFSHSCFFFLLTLTLLWSSLFGSSPPWLFPPLLFHLSILSEVWLLNFIRWYTNILTQYPMCVCIWIILIYIVIGLQALTYLRHIWVQKPPVQVVQVEIWPFTQERNGATCQEVFLPRPGRHIGWLYLDPLCPK